MKKIIFLSVIALALYVNAVITVDMNHSESTIKDEKMCTICD